MDQKEFEEGFKEMFRKNARAVLLFIKLAGGGSDSEDILQEVFLKAWKSYDKDGRRTQIGSALLYRIAKQVMIDARRRSVRTNGHVSSDQIDPLADPASNNRVRQERMEMVQEALSKLPIRQRTVVLLHMDGHEHADIGRQIGCSEKTSQRDWATALKHLRDALPDGLEE